MDFITGAHNLKELYGYWPSLHDSCLLGVDSSGDSIQVWLTIWDTPPSEGRETKYSSNVEVRFSCFDVSVARILAWQGDVHASWFFERDGYKEMRWSDQSSGVISLIRCSGISVEVLRSPEGVRAESIYDLEMVMF